MSRVRTPSPAPLPFPTDRRRYPLAVVVLEIRPGRDVDTVVLGRGERPPLRRVRLVGQAAACFESRRDSCLSLIRGHADVDVRPAAARLGRVQGLERDVWIASVSIDDVLTRAEAPVPEDGGPERTDIAAGILRRGNADHLDLGGVWLDLQPPGLDRDPAGQ